MTRTKVLVTGAGGFIGHHLVSFLKQQGYWVRAADLKHPEYAATEADEFEILDLRRWPDCLQATRGVEEAAMPRALVRESFDSSWTVEP